MKALIVGASSGIGKALAKELDNKGYELVLTARREELIVNNSLDFNKKPLIRYMDITDIDSSIETLNEIFNKISDLNLIILNAGVGMPNATFEEELNVIDVNVKGFTALASQSYKYFIENGGGHLVGISSIAGTRGMRIASAYAASKAYVSTYLEGLRHHAIKRKTNIWITDIRPGFVDTSIIKNKKNLFWVATPQKAARQIHRAIKRKSKVAYITRRYVLIYWLIKILPSWIYDQL